MEKCKNCAKDFAKDELSADNGWCYSCSTGDDDGTVTEANIKEAFVNISKDLGEKVNLTGKTVRERLGKMNKNLKKSGPVN
jgi:hypothetical protein